ncbi:hypothetical protein B5K08_32145 [Rhizobium leguminosarum bv. trifolii]|uniref:KAP NTPase domain-containing protein n=1 Tax=Rhizobium leguminosarum bv. trifolii TaxID=386 RepID=A0A3E1AZ15_RHILT|nr:hypothetical protein [Rhizobium leguminosarum]RFB82348.1 hypothetical protein B5K10_32140 [Rhizobium leguminosarum bv. trifolii]RFB82852.1 hypothetical protein B5K08_32145 [Rhizobium leguminosarum bv. trifolii]
MSTTLVRAEIAKFLSNPTPEVLCIRGNWGTGKTYSWNGALLDAAKNKAMTNSRYAYVSLFGVNSLVEAKQDIFHGSVDREKIGNAFDPSEVGKNYENVSTITKIGANVLDKWTGNTGVGASIVSLSIRDQLICFDDLERRGPSLQVGEVLGYISQLKEERQCKVVLLLNETQLGNRPDFDRYLEKVVDINLRFAPTALECSEIALPGTDKTSEIVKHYANRLGIDNIRIIRKIHRLVELIADKLSAYEPEVLESVAKSIVLLGWSHFAPETAPPLSYLRSKQSPWADILPVGDEVDPPDPKVQGWKAVLRKYGHDYVGPFDLVLMDGVVDGYFDQESIDIHATHLHRRTKIEAANIALRRAFERFDYSFTRQGDESVADLCDVFRKNVEYVALVWIPHVIKPLRTLGYTAEAQELIDLFFRQNEGNPLAFSMADLRDSGHELPEDVRQRCTDILQAQKPEYANAEILRRIGNSAEESFLAEKMLGVTVEEYLSIFRSHEGEALAAILRGASYGRSITNPTPTEVEIMDRAGEALRTLAAESPIFEMRARTWGLIQRLEAEETAERGE